MARGGGEGREGGREGRGGEGRATPNKNKRAFPPLRPKLDFNFRDIINFSRPLLATSLPPPCIIAAREKEETKRKNSLYYLEIRGSVTPVVGG